MIIKHALQPSAFPATESGSAARPEMIAAAIMPGMGGLVSKQTSMNALSPWEMDAAAMIAVSVVPRRLLRRRLRAGSDVHSHSWHRYHGENS